MILSVCMSPCTDVTIELDSLNVGRTNVVKNKSVAYAGKGFNVAIGAKRLGGEVYLTGLMYNENGYMFENVLDREGVPFSFVWNKGRARENYKFIDKRSMLTEVNDVGTEVGKEKLEEALAMVRLHSKKCKVSVLTGGLPANTDSSFYGELVKAVDSNSLKIVDALGGRMFSALEEGVDLVKPNLEELEHTLGRKISDKEDMLAGCYELIDRGARCVLLSLGRNGAVLTNGTENYFCKSKNIALNSTVGAGDAMVAAAALALEKGADLPEILRSGVAAGTARVMTARQNSFEKTTYDEVYAAVNVVQI